MTESAQDAVIGRVVRERSEAQRQVDLLTTEASRLGRIFGELGGGLQNDPAHVVFDGQGVAHEYLRGDGKPLYQAEDIRGDKVATLVDDLRTKLELLANLKRQAASLGV